MSLRNLDKPTTPPVTAHEVNMFNVPTVEPNADGQTQPPENKQASTEPVAQPVVTNSSPETNTVPTEAQKAVERNRESLVKQIVGANEPHANRQRTGAPGEEYDEVIDYMEEWRRTHQPETEAQRKERERKERSKKLIAAISDGLSAMSNLYFTTQYAPDSYERGRGQLNAVNGVIDKIKAERERDADKYLQYSLKIGDLKNQRAKTVREMEAERQRQKLAQEEAQRKAEQHNWLAALQPDKQREQAGKADKAEQDAAAARAVAESAPEMQEAKLQTEQARRGSYEASASASRASAANTSVQAKVNGLKGIYGTFDGKTYHNKRDYDKAVLEAAREYNKRNPITVTVQKDEIDAATGEKITREVEETRDPVDITVEEYVGGGKRKRNLDSADIAATLEPLLKAEREVAPHVRHANKDNTPPSKRK